MGSLRRSATVNGITTYYAYDGQTMVREMQKAGGTGPLVSTATYLCGPRGPEYRRDDTQTETDGQGHSFGKTRWYVYDGLGSVVGEVDPLGNLTSSPKYDVYGAVRANGGAASTRQGFVGGLGHVSDAETGLIYMRARYYDPSLGRFSSQDTTRDGINLFTYCNNNPVNLVDLNGNAPGSGLSFGEVGAGYAMLALSMFAIAATAAGLLDRAAIVLAIALASGEVYLCADGLKEVMAANPGMFAVTLAAESVALNALFGQAKGAGIKIMGTALPSVGNAVAACITESITLEIYSSTIQ